MLSQSTKKPPQSVMTLISNFKESSLPKIQTSKNFTSTAVGPKSLKKTKLISPAKFSEEKPNELMRQMGLYLNQDVKMPN